jgi:hypothetical protein
MYEYLFFVLCDDRGREHGYDKVALYVGPDGKPTHAARFWLDDPGWSSKLGEGNDIVHHALEAIEGQEYGTVRYVFKRKRRQA